VLQLHDINCDQVLTGLRLRVGLITSDEQQGSVHHCCTCQHGGHEGIVTGAIDERHMAHKHQVVIAALNGTLDYIIL